MTEGEPMKLIFIFSIPLLLGNLFQQFYSLVDTIIVGRLLGTNALAAVGSTGAMNFLILGFVFGLTSGFAVITAQKFGAKDMDGLRRSFAENIKLNAVSTVVFTALSLLLAKPVLILTNTPLEILSDAYAYIAVIFTGIFSMVLYNTSSCILRALGDSKSPLYYLIIASILNIILDIAFIVNFNMGVSGAAWATVVSQSVSGILSVIHILRKFPMLRLRKKDFRTDWWFSHQHLKIGLPMAFQFSITAVGVIILQGALNLFGSENIAAYTAAQKVEQLVAVGAGTFGVTMANYAGQNLGARRIDRIKEGTIKGSILTVAFSLIAMAIALIFPDELTSLFIDASTASGQEVIKASRTYLYGTAPFYPALFLIFIYRNVLQSIGKGFMPLMAGFAELIARTVAAYTFPIVFGFLGVALAGPFAWFAAVIPLCIAYFVIIRKASLYRVP